MNWQTEFHIFGGGTATVNRYCQQVIQPHTSVPKYQWCRLRFYGRGTKLYQALDIQELLESKNITIDWPAYFRSQGC